MQIVAFFCLFLLNESVACLCSGVHHVSEIQNQRNAASYQEQKDRQGS